MSDDHDSKPAALEVIRRATGPTGMSPMVAASMAILERNPDPQTLRELLQLQREWEANEARKAFEAAMVRLKARMPSVISRDAKVDFVNRAGQRTFYRHASLAHVLDEITPFLTDEGFTLTWRPSTGADGVTVTCRLTHAAGHFVETPPMSAPPDSSGNKSPAQQVASTITLLSRYSACALLGIATRDMPEPAGASDATEEQAAKVDIDRNMRGVQWLKSRGKTKEQAEQFLDKPLDAWNAADIEKLKKEWGAP